MYEAHFGLTRRPFVETVDPSDYVALPGRDAVLRRVRYGLEHGRGPALIFGPPGAGKTLLARALAREIGGPSAHLAFPALPVDELLALVAEDLGASPPLDASSSSSTSTTTPGPSVSIRRLRRHLSAAAGRGERPLLIVDEAQLIDDPSTFEALRLLLNFASLGPPDLSLLLVGGTDVLLHLPAGLSDRLTARCLLGPLSGPETSDYLLGRLSAAGASTPLFDAESIATLHRAADGLPRRLNRLADLALLVAYADGLPRPDALAIQIAAREADLDARAA